MYTDINSINAYSKTMDLRKTLRLQFIWVLALGVCVSASTKENHRQGCSIEGIDIGVCLNQRNSSFSIDSSCCKVLNKVVQTGYHCLCLLLASSFTLFTPPVSFPFSNCFINVPSLTLCRVVAPMPIEFPPNSPNEEITQPLVPPEESQFNGSWRPPSNQNSDGVASPPQGTQISSTSPPMMTKQQYNASNESNCVSNNKNEISKGKDKTETALFQTLFLFFALYFALYLC